MDLFKRLCCNMESAKDINIGVLTVSDTCFNGTKADGSGKKLLDIISAGDIIPKSKIVHYDIVPDEIATIAQTLVKWSNEPNCDVILTTGGTGFSERDVTPEATRNVIYKEAPGMMCAIMQQSLAITPLAMLSRGVCGIRKNTLIINLPGSLKAAVECLTFVSEAIPHAVKLLQNRVQDIAEEHKKLQSLGPQVKQSPKPELRVSKVNNTLVALRDRKSPFPMLEVDVALKLMENIIKRSEIVDVEIVKSLQYVLAEDITCVDPVPPFNASIKDGYAVVAADGSGERLVCDELAAGDMPEKRLEPGTCARINTGAAIPLGADAVVQVEDTEVIKSSSDGTKEITINIKLAPKVGLDIRKKGCDIEVGSVVLTKGTELKAVELGLLATVGKTTVKVYKKPTIGLLSTGNELQGPGETLKPGHIRDSNKTTLTALFAQSFYSTVDCGTCKDEPNDVLAKLESAFSKCDVLISTGGVSMGDKDVMKKVLKEDFNATIHFGRVNMKPGKPTTFATCEFQNKIKYIFALPGNPVSATVTAQLFVFPALDIMSGTQTNRNIYVTAGDDMKLDPERPEYHRAILKWEESGPVGYSTGNQLSSRLGSMLSANCLLILPTATPDQKVVTKGSRISALMLKS